MLLVGINAQAGSGKSTLAESLAAAHGFGVIALADPFKRFIQEVYGFSRDQLWGPSELRSMPDKRFPRPCTACHGAGRDERLHLSSPPCFVCNGVGVTYLTPREALQKIGSDWGRANYLNTWVDYTFRVIKQLEKGGHAYFPWTGITDDFDGDYKGYVIPDLRHVNEVKAARDHGGKLIRLKGSFKEIPKEFGQHGSEVEQLTIPNSDFDLIFDKEHTQEHRFQMATHLLGLKR
jgi:hypothetical protein